MAFDTEMCEVPEDEESIHETTAWNAAHSEIENYIPAHGILNTSQMLKQKSLEDYNIDCEKPISGYDGNGSRIESIFKKLPTTERIFATEYNKETSFENSPQFEVI